MRKTVTLREVANAAGVSKTTASNAFSRPERVRPALRERVEVAARRLGYEGPDPKGRLLSSGKVNAIGVVSPAAGLAWVFGSAYMQDFLSGIAEVCEPRGIGLSLVYDDDGSGSWSVRNAILDGFILSNIRQAELIEPALRRRLPFVVMDADAGPDINSVRVADRVMAKEMTRHLLRLGHRRIGVIQAARGNAPPVFHPPSLRAPWFRDSFACDEERIAGVAEALAEAGLSIADVPMAEGCGLEETVRRYGCDGVSVFMENAPDVTAVVCFSSELGSGMLAEARRRGIDVPRQLSVISVHNSSASALTDPPLTIAEEPAREKGRAAAELLLASGPPRQIVLPVPLVIRESTAPPPAVRARKRGAR